jgi:hypothetical protein
VGAESNESNSDFFVAIEQKRGVFGADDTLLQKESPITFAFYDVRLYYIVAAVDVAVVVAER